MTARCTARAIMAAASAAAIIAAAISFASPAAAAPPTVGLGDAASFAVLGGTEVTNVGLTTVSGDVGVSPGVLISGFPPGEITNGSRHLNDGPAADVQAATTAAYLDAAGRLSDGVIVGDILGGITLTPGVWNGGALDLTGNLTLDGTGDPDAVFIIQAASSLTTASSSTVTLVNANPCNVFWQVTSSAALGSDSDFVGTILVLTSITVASGADVNGRLLARNGNVTLISDNVTHAACGVPPATTTTIDFGGFDDDDLFPTTTTSSTTTSTTSTTAPTTTTSTTEAPTKTPTPTSSTILPTVIGTTDGTPTPTPTTIGPRVTGQGQQSPPTPPGTPTSPGTPGTPPGVPELPRTGTSTLVLAIGGAALVVLGSAAVRIERRARSAQLV